MVSQRKLIGQEDLIDDPALQIYPSSGRSSVEENGSVVIRGENTGIASLRSIPKAYKNPLLR